MMINNNQMINQMDQNQMLQMIQKNNEQIIQMIKQIFQVQMLNNMLLNQILTNNLNNNNNINNFSNLMNQMNNIMNNMNMMNNNSNMQNMMDNNMMNIVNNNDNGVDPWKGNRELRINIFFEHFYSGKKVNLLPPVNITVKELIEGFIKKCNIEKKNIDYIIFLHGTTLSKDDCRKITEAGLQDGSKILVWALQNKSILSNLGYL